MTHLLLNRRRASRRTPRSVCAVAVAVVLSVGCASTINGPTQRVAVGSDPPGARIFIGDQALGVTPTHVELNRGARDLALRFEKDCYRGAVVPVPRRTSKWVLGNALLAPPPVNDYTVGPWLGAMAFFFAVGGFLDWRSDGAFTLPDLVQASLERLPDAARAGESGGRVEAVGGPEVDDGCAPGVSAGAGAHGIAPAAQ